jgi:D-alanyl-D-alanine carboxypeptidase/D-alanyl-D-alanine-endopeptidase (penicillin-binding protein 4)
MRLALTFILLGMVVAPVSSPTPVLANSAQQATQVGAVPPAAQAVIDKPEYRTARWLYDVVDLDTGQVLLGNRANELVFTGSTAKEFTIGGAYEALGTDYKVTTPVYATSVPSEGVLAGDLVLVASGNLGLGGRNALEGNFDSTFTATTIDHVYADLAPNAVKPPGDPLAGLNSLVQQVEAAGVTRIDGEIIIDGRLWQVLEGQEAPVPPSSSTTTSWTSRSHPRRWAKRRASRRPR